MRILAIDTCFEACSVALYDAANEVSLAERSEPMARGHAEALLGMIAEVTAHAGVALTEVDRFAVTTGPGSFTGVRVGLAAARGLALAADKPVVGISTLELLCAMATETGPVAAVHDARRGEVFLAATIKGNLILEPMACAAEDAPAAIRSALGGAGGTLALTGSGASLVAPNFAAGGVKAKIVPVPEYLSPILLARLAAARPDPGGTRPSALYLRAPDAKLPAVPLAPPAAP